MSNEEHKSLPLTQAAPPKPSKLRSPGIVLLAGVLVAAAAFSTTLFTWVQAQVQGVLGEQNLEITGSKAAPAVSALAMVALAAPLVARIAPHVVRYIVALVSIGAGIGMVLSAYTVMTNPADAVVTETSKATGTVANAGTYVVTFWPWVALVCGILVVCVGLWTLAVARYWSRSRKYERRVEVTTGEAEELDNMDAWDLLSQGEDPTSEK